MGELYERFEALFRTRSSRGSASLLSTLRRSFRVMPPPGR
jgi:hypothetical protein